MQNTLYVIQEFIGMKASVIAAGLAGALITFLRKQSGSLKARTTGYLVAMLSVLYVVPFIIHLFEWRVGIELQIPAQNLLSFIWGMLSQTITESFVDEPLATFEKGVGYFKRIKDAVWSNGTMPQIVDKTDAENKEIIK